MPRPAISILQNGRLNIDFLNGCALPNARAVINELAPEDRIRGRSLIDLLQKIPEEGIEVTPEGLRRAVWGLMDEGYSGNVHISLVALNPLMEAGPVERMARAHASWRAVVERNPNVVTGQVLDSVFDEGLETLKMIYVGQAEADVYDENESYDQVINGSDYVFRAYRVVDVPVFSRVDVSLANPYITVTTRAVHQKVKPLAEVEGVRTTLEEGLQVPVPPLGGIGAGIRALWEKSIFARRYESHEADGSRVILTCAPGAKNKSSQTIEEQLATWDFRNGALTFQEAGMNASFHVDAGRAAFSFGARVSREDANRVISAIIAAA